MKIGRYLIVDTNQSPDCARQQMFFVAALLEAGFIKSDISFRSRSGYVF